MAFIHERTLDDGSNRYDLRWVDEAKAEAVPDRCRALILLAGVSGLREGREDRSEPAHGHHPRGRHGRRREDMREFVAAKPTSFVFNSPRERPLRASNFARHWNEARIRVQRQNLRPHEPRHPANTRAAMSVASVRELMGRMGHASQRAAIRYQHLARSDQGIADNMSRTIAASRTPQPTDEDSES